MKNFKENLSKKLFKIKLIKESKNKFNIKITQSCRQARDEEKIPPRSSAGSDKKKTLKNIELKLHKLKLSGRKKNLLIKRWKKKL